MDERVGLLLATVATSAAALVAIVGGLLVSRLVSLATERSGLIHRREDLNAQHNTELNRLYDLEHRLRASNAQFVLRPRYGRLADPSGEIDLEAWIAEEEVRLTPEQLQPFLEQLQQVFAEARERLLPGFEEGRLTDFVFDELIEGGAFKLPPGHRDIYNAVYDQLAEEFLPPPEEREDFLFEDFPDYPELDTGIEPPLFSVVDQQQHTQLEQAIDESHHRCAALEVQTEQARLALSRVTHPEGVRQGVYVLAYLGGAGTLVPFLMMMFETPSPAAGWIAIGVFASGLAALLRYLVWQANHLTDDPDDNPAEASTGASAP